MVQAAARQRASESFDAQLDERALVESARGDRQAFSELYRRYVRRVYGFAYKRTGAPQLAEDITSATFESALRGIGEFRWRSGGFEAWLFRIAANKIADSYKSNARPNSERGQRAMGALTQQYHVDEIADHLSAGRVRAAMNTLNERYQRALSLKYLCELSADDAARAMGQPKALFAVTVHRATVALRRAIEMEGAGE